MRKILVVVVLVSSLCGAADIDDSEFRLTGPLVRAGIKLDDEAALIRTLQAPNDPRLACCAAYALGKLARNETIVRELNAAAQAKDEILMGFAIRSLLKHGDRQWVGAASARLPNVKNDIVRLRLADDLAQAGCYDGWEMIEAAIVDGSVAEQEIALFGVESFQGMKDSAGKPIDLVQRLDSMMVRAPEANRTAIFVKIVHLSSAKIPRTRPRAARPKP
jgi:hypothetical protein